MNISAVVQRFDTGPTEELAPALVVSGASVIPFPKEHRP